MGVLFMKKIMVVGSGNVGLAAAKALQNAPDMALLGFLRRKNEAVSEFPGVPTVTKLENFSEKPDGAILAIPSEKVEALEKELLSKGICTVDAYDIHSNLVRMREELGKTAIRSQVVAVIGAGWDPGLDSSLRVLFKAAVPLGRSETVFGPGVSLGHTVAAKAVAGVRDAVSWTLPGKKVTQKRKVYIVPKRGEKRKDIEHAIRTSHYFEHDTTEICFQRKIDRWKKDTHRVRIRRWGCSAGEKGQKLSFSMDIHNPALTGELLVAVMRAAFRKEPGCYFFPELSPVDLLPETVDWERLV